MSQTLGTSNSLGISTLEVFISKICTFHICVFNKVFCPDVSPYCFLHAFSLSESFSAYNILKMTCKLCLRQIPKLSCWCSDVSRDGHVFGFSLHVHERLLFVLWVASSSPLVMLCSSYTHGLRIMVNGLAKARGFATHKLLGWFILNINIKPTITLSLHQKLLSTFTQCCNISFS